MKKLLLVLAVTFFTLITPVHAQTVRLQNDSGRVITLSGNISFDAEEQTMKISLPREITTTFSLYNMLGAKVRSTEIFDGFGMASFDPLGLKSGIYMFVVTVNNQKYYGKLNIR